MSKKANGQRIAILAIVGAFVVSSLGFSGLVIWDIVKNKDKNQSANANDDLQKQLEEQLKESQVNNEPLDGYNAAPFDKASVVGLKVEKLVEGNGKVASAESTVKANYFGWTSDGKIFDSSKKNGKAEPVEFPLNGVIKGWTEGLTGVAAGSVVRLTIPADKAYGENGSPPTIGPNEPLVFIVQLTEVN